MENILSQLVCLDIVLSYKDSIHEKGQKKNLEMINRKEQDLDTSFK